MRKKVIKLITLSFIIISLSINGKFFSVFENASAQDPDELLPMELDINVELHFDLPQTFDSYYDVIKEGYDKAAEKYSEYFSVAPLFHINIYLQLIPGGKHSYHRYHTIGLPDEIAEPTFDIYINHNQPEDIMLGSLYFELCQAYQYQYGIKEANDQDEWLMDATAMWAVNLVDQENDYEKSFNKYIHNKPCEPYDNMDENLRRSWYQLFYYATEVIGIGDFVEQILFHYGQSKDLNDAFKEASADREYLRKIFGGFGEIMAVDPPDTFGMLADVSNISGDEMMFDANNSFDEELVVNDMNGEWQEIHLPSFGYNAVMIEMSGSEGNNVEILNNLEDSYKNKTGMSVIVYEDEHWKNELKAGSNDAIASLDLKTRDIEKIFLVFYSYEMKEDKTHKYNVAINTQIDASGYIECSVTKRTLQIDDGPTNEKAYKFKINEDIKLFKPANSEENGDMQALMLGDVYYIDKMTVNYNSNQVIDYQDGDKVEKNSSGSFTYNDGDAGPNIFDTSMASQVLGNGLLSGDSDDNTPEGEAPFEMPLGELSLDQLQGAEGIADLFSALGGGESDGENPEAALGNMLQNIFGGAAEASEGSLENDVQAPDGLDMSSVMESFMPPSNQLNRFKIDYNSSIFHIYPVLPPNLISDEWITTVTKATYIDDNGDKKTSTVTEKESPDGKEFFPTWLHNPFYSEEKALDEMENQPMDQEAFMEEFSDLADITSKISDLNSNLDESNMSKVLNQGQFTFESEEVHPKLEGVHKQEVSFEDNVLTGTILANYLDQNATEYEVYITFKYIFD